MDRSLLPWQRVEVSGPSMTPTLRSGDVLVVRHGAPVRPGDVVLARFRSLPDRLVLKRAVRPEAGGRGLAPDTPWAGGESDRHGVPDALARAVLRGRPGPPRRVR